MSLYMEPLRARYRAMKPVTSNKLALPNKDNMPASPYNNEKDSTELGVLKFGAVFGQLFLLH
ncbi:hypothetical protein [Peribacillus glennii]|uniref:Uncharacterized protein n=1 Tax=Peribacillus glennii TaxID=2303991 RepID=A0A372LJX1_9BACI|nr:hypothetical protein [Peribacillus glennii]RFU66747.1 hypothetical protein D0466_01155 [Peribacillus glennii]